MSASRPLGREEQALEDFLAATSGLVAVCVTEPFHPGAQLVSERLRQLGEEQTGLHVVSIGLEGYRLWTERHAIFGTPCVALFREGRLLRRLNGVLTDEQLRAQIAGLA